MKLIKRVRQKTLLIQTVWKAAAGVQRITHSSCAPSYFLIATQTFYTCLSQRLQSFFRSVYTFPSSLVPLQAYVGMLVKLMTFYRFLTYMISLEYSVHTAHTSCVAVPGVMMMLFASFIMSIVWSMLTSVWVPTISMGLPPAVEVVPYPPRITLGRERFIAFKEENKSGSGHWTVFCNFTCGQICASTHHTHDVGEDGTRRANQSSNDGHEIVLKQETFSTQCPSRIAVQHGDDYGHVSAPDSCCQCYTLWGHEVLQSIENFSFTH